MCRKIFFIILIVFSFCAKTIGQNDSQLATKIEKAKFQIIKTTVIFLASDSITFGKVSGNCENCEGYEELITFSKDNKLSLVPKLIDRYKNLKLDKSVNSWKSSIDSLKESLVKEITVDNAKKHRLTHKKYQSYLKKLDIIIASVKPQVKVDDNDNKSDNSDNIKKGDAKDVEELDYLSLIPFAIILLLAILTGFTFYIYDKGKKQIKKLEGEHKQLKIGSSYLAEQNKIRIESLEFDLSKANSSIESLQEDLRLERRKSQQTTALNQSLTPSVYQQTPTKNESPIKYSIYADQGDGFTASDLLNEETSESIFEITIMSHNTAKFKISTNLSAQKYALANAAYFFDKTCKYDTLSNGVIRTDVPGELKLQGNKWQIISPAKISFS
jgi:hypothetical protein